MQSDFFVLLDRFEKCSAVLSRGKPLLFREVEPPSNAMRYIESKHV